MAVNKRPTVCVLCDCPIPVNGGNECEGGFAHPACLAVAAQGDFSKQVMTIETNSGTYTQNVKGRCEDAPCCG